MTALDEFLQATDLDDLLRARQELPPNSSEDSTRIRSSIAEWRDQQMVANLLFYPGLIPTDIRFAAIDKALRSTDAPYLALAAVVGLQSIQPADVSDEKRNDWRQILLGMVQSGFDTLATRASGTMFSWHLEMPYSAEVLKLFPVANETASKNILAFALKLFGDLPAEEFSKRLVENGVAKSAIGAFTANHVKYLSKAGNSGAEFMKFPLLCYIPNLSELAVSAPRKPWWKLR